MRELTIFDAMDRLFDQVNKIKEEGVDSFIERTNYPRADVYNTPDFKEYVIECSVPGMTQDQIKVQIEDGNVVVSGEAQEKFKAGKVYSNEIKRSRWQRTFRFGRGVVESDGISCSLKNGILKITIKNANVSKDSVPIEIEVN